MDTRGIIMKAAFELFEDRPFHKISVEEIIQKAHVSRRTFYQYFRDKYSLMHEYFRARIGSILIEGYDGTNWFGQTKNSFDYFLSHAPYLLNIKNTHGQDPLWDFLIKYVGEFYASVKEHNKKAPLSREELLIAEGIAAVSVHFYQYCINHPENIDSKELTEVLSAMIPVTYRLYNTAENAENAENAEQS